MHCTYPAVIETDDEGGFSAYFPDLPGCAAAGETVEACYADAGPALALHLRGMIADGEPLPPATTLHAVTPDPDVRVAAVLLVSADVSGKRTRINVTMDSAVLAAIDAVTTNRSAFLADAAMEALKRRSSA
ncbi:hypothetical protein C882_0957 [Caenispirillum salinarum AK4]|uniref:HicB-like antitoxin of toxin-antitoxin system domain-containing protein n=1 Tax=Caenispirillum salinarum AK4 TaxID=1238182 RepID=K9HCW5_9PROT|nr:type II toxin-antitoxin system HicB family antitoxin [Caenispirillum salinarum]EKV28383.1 hypothetical protein C882_0957 [Caenispirillum salinarum AK4]